MKQYLCLCLGLLSIGVMAKPAPNSYLASHNAFFQSLTKHCGKAFQGKVVVDTSNSESFANQNLVMDIRQCEDTTIHIPFHVGSNASRTWIISKTNSGLILKHDHRHQDGKPDDVTMYGGITTSKGWAQVQSFPADPYTQEMFVEQGLYQSIDNIWQIFVDEKTFTYRLTRAGFEFKVVFDLTKPVEKPQTPWGYE